MSALYDAKDPLTWSKPMRHKGCGGTFDAGRVQVLARYVDCSVWRCPVCKKRTDDREWTAYGCVDWDPRERVVWGWWTYD